MELKINNKKRYYLLYSLLFLGLSGLILFFYYSKGKSLIDFNGDGFRQHYRALLYYSDLLKSLIRNPFTVPQWDYSIGEGSDVLSTFHYYGIGDILLLPSVIFPQKYMYVFYDLSVLYRMYLSGIAFSILAIYLNRYDYKAILCGALLYAFCGFSLVNLSGHTIFLSALVYLPMLIHGVELVIHKDKPYLLSLFVCLASVSNIYFFYMNVIMTIIYVVCRLLCEKEDIRTKARHLLAISLFSVLGVLMSFIIFLPMAYSMLSNGRLSESFHTPIFYDLSEYRNIYTSFVFGYGTYYGNYSILAVFAIIQLFRKRENRLLQILLIIGLIMLSFPFFGKLFNGMIYPTIRWVYGISFLISFIVTDRFDELKECVFLSLIIISLYFISCCLLNTDNAKIYIMFLLLSFFFCAVARIGKLKAYTDSLAVLIVLFSIFFSILFRYSPLWWNYTDNGTDISAIADQTYPDKKILESIDDQSFWRYSGDSVSTNSSVNSNCYSDQYYWSIANSDVIEFRKQLGLLDHNNHHYDNYDERYALNALSSVKYYICSKQEMVPYHYSSLGNYDEKELYVSLDSLPLIYAYRNTVSSDRWNSFNVVEKNEALAQAAFVENNNENENEVQFLNKTIDTKTECFDMTMENGIITTVSSQSYLTLSFGSKEQGEYYLVIEGFDSDENINLEVENPQGIVKTVFFKTRTHTAYADKHDFMVNLGCFDGLKGNVVVRFPIIGTYTYRNIRIVCQPMTDQLSDIYNLKNSLKIKDINVSTNGINSSFVSQQKGMLCIAVPYSKGWSAKLDGQNIDINKVNIMYMGFPVSEGEHQIELKYHTPLLREGTLVSVVAFAFFFYYAFNEGKKNV